MKSPVLGKKQRLGGQSDKDFLKWFVDDFLPEFFPEALNVDRSLLLRMHATGLRYARHFGFEARPDQTQFLALMNDVGPDFWRFAGFREAMERENLSPEDRIKDVYTNVTGPQFEAALMGQDPLYWFPHQVEKHALGME